MTAWFSTALFFWYPMFSVGCLLFFGRLQNPVLLVMSSKTVDLEGLPSLLLHELEHFTDFARILVLMCFLRDNLA